MGSTETFIAEVLARNLQADTVTVYLLDPWSNWSQYRLAHMHGLCDPSPMYGRIDISANNRFLAQPQEILVVPRIEASGLFVASPFARRESTESVVRFHMLHSPLYASKTRTGTPLPGAIAFLSYRHAREDLADCMQALRIARSSLGYHLREELDREDLHRSSYSEHAGWFAQIMRTMSEVTASGSTQDILRKILDCSLSIAGASLDGYAAIYLVNQEGDAIRRELCKFNNRLHAAVGEPIELEAGNSVPCTVAKSRTPLLLSDIRDMPATAGRSGTHVPTDIVGATKMHSLVAVPILMDSRVVGVLEVQSPKQEAFRPTIVRALDVLADACAVSIHEREISGALKTSLEATIVALCRAIRFSDDFTATHQERVALIACAIGEELGLSTDQIQGLRIGALVHDIGKVEIPRDVLTQTRRLSGAERSMIMHHPEVGYAIVADIPFPWPVAKITAQHHERLDGSGYPSGLKGDEIILEARIVAVADTLEAMASFRPYKVAKTIDEALTYLSEQRGSEFDSRVVDACVNLFSREGFQFLPEYPQMHAGDGRITGTQTRK
jgi:putative nucleotidyltransferase with HDIG domain